MQKKKFFSLQRPTQQTNQQRQEKNLKYKEQKSRKEALALPYVRL